MSWECNLSLEILEEFAGRQSHVEDDFIEGVVYQRHTVRQKQRARSTTDRRAYFKAHHAATKADPKKWAIKLRKARVFYRRKAKRERMLKRELERLIPSRKPVPISKKAKTTITACIASCPKKTHMSRARRPHIEVSAQKDVHWSLRAPACNGESRMFRARYRLLRLLSAGPMTREAARPLRVELTMDASPVRALVKAGFVSKSGDTYSITDTGRAELARTDLVFA